MSKAQIVVDTYDETRAKNESPLACYHAAWGATKYQGALKSGTAIMGRSPLFHLLRIRFLNFRIRFLNSMMDHLSV